jgi:hypothetical protein
MPEPPELAVVRAAWLDQPDESIPVDIQGIHRQRTRELFFTTRSEITGSAGAALFFAGVVAWRFAPERDRLLQFGCAAVILWAALSIFRFRRSMRRPVPQADALARTGLEHYRAELLRRRDHLRSAWIWHGPLLLACILSVAALAKRIVPARLWDALPVFLVLAATAVMGIRRRLREAAGLQQEIDETGGAESPPEE